MTYNPDPMPPDLLLEAFDRMSAAIAPTARNQGVVTIESCAPWTSHDLLTHLGQVYAMVNEIIIKKASEPLPPGPDSSAPEDFAQLLTWFETRRLNVSQTLSTTDPELGVWTWGKPSTVAFYIRRMAHETAVHLFDLQTSIDYAALGVDRKVMCDGIDEYFEVVLPRTIRRLNRQLPTAGLHLHCTDGVGEWMVKVDGGELQTTHEHAKAAVAWRGSAPELFLACWGRFLPTVEVLGDSDISNQWAGIAP